MKEYTIRIQRATRLLFFTLALAILLWGITPYKILWQGVILGLILGGLAMLHIAWKIHLLGQAVAEGRRRPNLGMVTRLSLGALGAVLVLRLPEYFSLEGLVIGLFIPSVFALGDAIFSSLQSRR